LSSYNINIIPLLVDVEEYVSPWSSVCERIATEKITRLVDSSNPFNAGKLNH